MNENLKEIFNGAELRRLQKAARDKDITKLVDWAKQFEEQLNQLYEQDYKKQLSDSIDNFILAIVFTLHFNEKTKFRW